MKEKMKRGKDERKDFSSTNVSGPSNPPDELTQNVSKKKKNLSGELFLHFSSKVQNLTVLSISYMIRIRFFGSGELNQRAFSGARYGVNRRRACGRRSSWKPNPGCELLPSG